MLTIDPIQVCELPISRQQAGFSEQGDGANALLLIAQEVQPAAQVIYQQAGYISEGFCITCCSLEVYAILKQMQLRWCPWPDRGFTLAVLGHNRIGLLADRLMVSWRAASDRDGESDHSDEKKEA